MILRPAQIKFREDLRDALRSNRAVLGVASCGFGKGTVMQNILMSAVEKDKHVLMLVHGRDRVNDAVERATKLGIPHGVLMGSKKRERWHKIQLASSDTVHRMKDKPKGDLIVIDEAHLSLSPTFRGVLEEYPNAKIIGLTATPVLGNGKPLGIRSGGIFDSMVKGPSVKELISDGHLVRSEVIAPTPPTDLKGLKKLKTGEFDSEQGAAICDNAKIIGDVVDHYRRYASHLKAVSFGFNQKHAFDIAESFRAAGFNWAYVDANTPDGDIHTPGTRKFIWHQYDNGDLQGISAVGVVATGWDHAVCKCLLLCSKTSSLPLYHQRLGRGSRPHTGHDHFRVHDHTGNLFEFMDVGPFFESEIDWKLDGPPSKDSEKRMSTCDQQVPGDPAPRFIGPYLNGVMLPCMRPFETGPRECPNCFIPIVTAGRDASEIEAEAGELEAITEEMRAAAEDRIRAQSVRKAEYLDLVKLQKNKGYKKGYPAIIFKSKYGQWPPSGWKAEVEFAAGVR